jgi:aryl-alcohol dehydrogenase-like predicted oxidoreductase
MPGSLEKYIGAKAKNMGSRIGYGSMGVSEFYGPTPDRGSAVQIFRQAFTRGVRFFDTADMYGNGLSEQLIGEALADVREQVVIATKVGIRRDVSVIGHGIGRAAIVNDKNYIKEACQRSLDRLGTSYIDVFYLHRLAPDASIEQCMAAMKELLDEGKIRSVGLSEVNLEVILQAREILGDKLVSVQTEYSFISREAVEEILPVCRELGINVVAYSPIGRGLFSGQFRDPNFFKSSEFYDFRADLPRFNTADNLRKNNELVDALGKVAERKGCSTTQLALAWVLAQGDDIIPIPGTSSLRHLEENMAATQIKLTPEDLEEMDSIYRQYPPAGLRMPPGDMEYFRLRC